MGFAGGEDFLRGAGFDELGEELAGKMSRILDAGIELAVGEGAGAALAELDIGLGVENAAAPEGPGVLGALADGLAALEDERPKTHLGEGEGGHQATGAGADDDGPAARGGDVDGETVAGVGGGAEAGEARENGGLVAEGDVDGVDEVDRRAAAGVVGSAGDGEAEEVVGGDGKTGQHRVAEGVGRVVQGQFEFGQAEHGDTAVCPGVARLAAS